MKNLNTELEEIKRLKKVILELNNQIKAQAETNPKKLPMYRGDEDRCDEVIKALEDEGGVNRLNCSGEIPYFFYYIGESNIIEFTNDKWLVEQLFELKELPPKKIELIEGEFYKCKDILNDTCIFIYKNTNEYDTSFLCGIHISGSFTESSTMHFGTINNILPATQEQKEILLKRIDDEGYVYNKEKVTLEKKKEVVEFTLSAANYDKMIVRNYINQEWKIKIFNKQSIGFSGVIDSDNMGWTQVLPFNEETERLINTTIIPNEEYILIS